MRALYIQFGGLVALLAFASQWMNQVALSSALLQGAVAGLLLTGLLVGGDLVVQMVLNRVFPETPSEPDIERDSPPAASDASESGSAVAA